MFFLSYFNLGILFTPIDTASHNSWNVAMRQQLDIYASLVVCKTLPGYPTRHKDVDFAIIRENTEGEYSGLEHQVSFCFADEEDFGPFSNPLSRLS